MALRSSEFTPSRSISTSPPPESPAGDLPLVYDVESEIPKEYEEPARKVLEGAGPARSRGAVWRAISKHIKVKWMDMLVHHRGAPPDLPKYTVRDYPLQKVIKEGYATMVTRWPERERPSKAKVARLLQSTERQLAAVSRDPLLLEAVRTRLPIGVLNDPEKPESFLGRYFRVGNWGIVDYAAGKTLASIEMVFGLATPTRPDPPIQLKLVIYSSRLPDYKLPPLPPGEPQRVFKFTVFRIDTEATATTLTAVLMHYVFEYEIDVFFASEGVVLDATSPDFIHRLFNPTKQIDH